MAATFPPVINGTTATFTLSGRLDAVSAPALAEELKKLIGKKLQKVMFNAADLAYLSSAGLRAIVFAKQKLGADPEVIILRPQADVLGVIKMAGFDSFLTIEEK
jgi:anti-anti-sigma factor